MNAKILYNEVIYPKCNIIKMIYGVDDTIKRPKSNDVKINIKNDSIFENIKTEEFCIFIILKFLLNLYLNKEYINSKELSYDI